MGRLIYQAPRLTEVQEDTMTTTTTAYDCHTCDNYVTTGNYIAQIRDLQDGLAFHFGCRPQCEDCVELSQELASA
jgi:hypothetical protein